MTSADCDIAVIGGGMGGYAAAIRASQRGAKVVLIERDRVGGTCLNYGCIPTKAMLRDAELYRDAASGRFALRADKLAIDYDHLLRRKRAVVDALVGGVEKLLAANGVRVVAGEAEIAAPGQVRVQTAEGAEVLSAGSILVATGSRPLRLRVPGAELPGVLDTTGLLEYPHRPRSLVVIGASAAGMEFACLFHALDVPVTVLDREFFIREADQQLAKRLMSMLRQKGMRIAIGAEIESIEPGLEGLRVNYRHASQQLTADGEVVLVAIGRAPDSAGLGLRQMGAEYDGPALVVDRRLRTSVAAIYAAGDCIGGQMLAHVAAYEGEVAVANILGEERYADYTVVPNCVYTLPEIAGVGLTESAARERGVDCVVTRFPFSASGRALTLGEMEGQVRLVCERGGRVLGAHIMGPHASELAAEAALAIRLGASAADISGTIHAHPTLSEALAEAAMAQGPGALHFTQR